jgi:hypothetical protein
MNTYIHTRVHSPVMHSRYIDKSMSPHTHGKLGTFDGEHTLVTKQLLALGFHEFTDPILKLHHVHVADKFETDRAHRRVVLVFRIGIQKIGFGHQNLVQIKGTNIHD